MAKDTQPVENPFDEAAQDDAFAEADGLFEKAASTFEKITDYKGQLIMAKFVAFEGGTETQYGDADRVTADVVVLDGEDAPKELGEIMIYQKVIIGQLKGKKRPVVGVLTQRKSTQRGRSDAWVLDSDQVTPEQIKVAKEYLLSQQAVDTA